MKRQPGEEREKHSLYAVYTGVRFVHDEKASSSEPRI